MQQVWRKGSFDDWRKKPFITFFSELAVFEVSIFFYGLMPCCVCLRWVPKVVSTRKMTSSGGSASSIYFKFFPPSMMEFSGHVRSLSGPCHKLIIGSHLRNFEIFFAEDILNMAVVEKIFRKVKLFKIMDSKVG